MESYSSKVQTKKFDIVKIQSKEDAIQHGKNRGWCTSDEDGYHYDNTYSKDQDDLFVLYEKGKKKSEFQLFISKRGSVEFRRKFNKIENFNEIAENDQTLKDWYEEQYSDLVDSQIVGRSSESTQIIIDDIQMHIHNQHTRINMTVYLIEHQLIFIHNESEMPNDLDLNCIYLIENSRLIMIYSPEFNFQKIYLQSYQASSGQEMIHSMSGEYQYVNVTGPRRVDFELMWDDRNNINELDFLNSLDSRFFMWSIQRG